MLAPGAVHRRGALRWLACPACHGAGIPEAVAGHACAVAVCTCGARDLLRRWRCAPAGRMISRAGSAPAGPLRCTCPAVGLAMVTACRWWWQGVLAPGAVEGHACAVAVCTCEAYDLRRRGWCACGA